MLTIKHDGQLAAQCLSSFPGHAFSSVVDMALETFGSKALYYMGSVETLEGILEGLRPVFHKAA